jgi:hypothetical protein
MRPQDHLEFFEKRNAPMMFFQPFDVTMNLCNLRLAHSERAVPFLPREGSAFLERSRNPAGRVRLQFTDQLGDRLVLAEFREHMDVIRSSVYDQRGSAFTADCAAKLFVNPRADRGNHPGFAVLRSKHDVIQEIAMGGTHNTGPFRRPFSGAGSSFDHTTGSFATLHCRLYSGAPPALDRVAGDANQRRRRAGLKPGVQQSGTPGNDGYHMVQTPDTGWRKTRPNLVAAK